MNSKEKPFKINFFMEISIPEKLLSYELISSTFN